MAPYGGQQHTVSRLTQDVLQGVQERAVLGWDPWGDGWQGLQGTLGLGPELLSPLSAQAQRGWLRDGCIEAAGSMHILLQSGQQICKQTRGPLIAKGLSWSTPGAD